VRRIERDESDGEKRNRVDKKIKAQKAEQTKKTSSSSTKGRPTVSPKRSPTVSPKQASDDDDDDDKEKSAAEVKQQIREQRIKRDESTGDNRKQDDGKIHKKQNVLTVAKKINEQRRKRDQQTGPSRHQTFLKLRRQQKVQKHDSTATFISTLESLKKQIRTLRAQRDEAGDAEKRDALKQKIEKKKVQREQMIRQHEKEAKEQEQDARKKAVQHAKQVKLAKQQKASYNKTHKAFAAALQGLSEKLQALRVKRDTAVDDETSESLTLQIRRIKAKRDQMEKSNPVDPNKY